MKIPSVNAIPPESNRLKKIVKPASNLKFKKDIDCMETSNSS